MFNSKTKLDPYLKDSLAKNLYKSYRLIIKGKLPNEKLTPKIKALGGIIHHSIDFIKCVSTTVPSKSLIKLLELPEIKFISTDTTAYLCATKLAAPAFNLTMSVRVANVIFKTDSKVINTGSGIRIGLVDSGVFPHPDLSSPVSKILFFLDLINELHHPYDDNGHGTFIAALITSNGKSSKGLYTGISPGAELCTVKAFDSSGRGKVSSVLKAIEELLKISQEYNIKVLCLPFELYQNDFFLLSLFEELFAIAASKNIVVLVPSGSDGSADSTIKGISTLQSCITVGGVDTIGGIGRIVPYDMSSRGPIINAKKPDLVAAAVNICSANTCASYISERNGRKLYPPHITELYTAYSGTSCAVAYIASLCALLYESNPILTNQDIISLLKLSCMDTSLPIAVQGNGIIQLNKLLP